MAEAGAQAGATATGGGGVTATGEARTAGTGGARATGTGATIRARVLVTLREGVLDPQGQAIEAALAGLGHGGVSSVRQGKVFELEIEPGGDPRARVEAMCEALLANTVIERYRVEIAE